MKYIIAISTFVACGASKVPENVSDAQNGKNGTPIEKIADAASIAKKAGSITGTPDINVKSCPSKAIKELGSTYVTSEALTGDYKGFFLKKSFTANAVYQFRSEITATSWNELISAELNSIQPSEAKNDAQKNLAAYLNSAVGITKFPVAMYFTDDRGCQLGHLSSLTTRAGDKSVSVLFDKSLPVFNIAQFSPADLKTFLKTPLNIQNISAKIQSSNDPQINPGSVTGSMVIALDDEKALVPSGTKGLMPPDCNFAFKVSYNFGSARATSAMGLKPDTTYYMKDDKIIATAVNWRDTSISLPRLYFNQ